MIDKKTIVLVVSSEKDCGVSQFESYNLDKGIDVVDWVKKFQDEDRYYVVVEEDGYLFNVEYYEFGCIDPDFVELIRNDIQDYDSSKNTNFYVEGVDFYLEGSFN